MYSSTQDCSYMMVWKGDHRERLTFYSTKSCFEKHIVDLLLHQTCWTCSSKGIKKRCFHSSYDWYILNSKDTLQCLSLWHNRPTMLLYLYAWMREQMSAFRNKLELAMQLWWKFFKHVIVVIAQQMSGAAMYELVSESLMMLGMILPWAKSWISIVLRII